MSGYILTEPAAADIDEIEEYIAADNPDAARRLILKLRSAMQQLAAFPGIGQHRKDVADPRYRFWTVSPYVIVYDPDTSPLQIIRVIHGHRDMPTVLE